MGGIVNGHPGVAVFRRTESAPRRRTRDEGVRVFLAALEQEIFVQPLELIDNLTPTVLDVEIKFRTKGHEMCWPQIETVEKVRFAIGHRKSMDVKQEGHLVCHTNKGTLLTERDVSAPPLWCQPFRRAEMAGVELTGAEMAAPN
uniref:Uncharacterized protein n=1 Tax=Romanomermis culicivorax TaxID=13658 RepID=A0A915K784_ROMCU